jgi:trimeric autotransporter adhesin
MKIARSAALAAACVLSLSTVEAQCTLDWLPGAPEAGPNGTVYNLLPLPNGELLAVGDFDRADSAFARSIARWDGSDWLALGGGIEGDVQAAVVMPNGDLVVGGSFTMAGGQPASSVARWDGASWSPMGLGLGGPVEDLLVMPNGDLFACGEYFGFPNLLLRRLVRWNGVAWSQVGNPPFGAATSLELAANGDLLIGGSFPGNGPLLRWDGNIYWLELPTLTSGAGFLDMARLANGTVICVGQFGVSSASTRVASFDGTSLTSLQSPLAGRATSVIVRASGDVVVSGRTATGQPSAVASWNGASWTSLPATPGDVEVITESGNGELVVGLRRTTSLQHSVHRFDGLAWQSMGAPVPPQVRAMATAANGDVYIAGQFSAFAGNAANSIVRWDGANYSALGQGITGTVEALAVAPNGDLYVAGSFSGAGGSPATSVARWNGQIWSTLGLAPQPGLPALAMTVVANGDVYLSYSQLLFRFDASGWADVTPPSVIWTAREMVALPSGAIALAGVFLFPSSSAVVGLVEFDNGVAQPFPGVGPNFPLAFGESVIRAQNGDLIVTGNRSGRWDGSNWTQLPIGLHGDVVELPDGDLLAATGVGNLNTTGLQRTDGTTISSYGNVEGQGLRIAVSGAGDVLLAGGVDSINGLVSARFAHAIPTCRAQATIVGAGCSGSSGTPTLQADNLPWIGGVYRSNVTGLTQQSLAVQVFGGNAGFQLPGAASGCLLFVNPAVTTIELVANGTAAMTFLIPDDVALIGVPLRQQVVAVELGATGITQLATSNGLELTIGAL